MKQLKEHKRAVNSLLMEKWGYENKVEEEVASGQLASQEKPKVSRDVEKISDKLAALPGLETLMNNINTQDEFEDILSLFINLASQSNLSSGIVKQGVRKVATDILKQK